MEQSKAKLTPNLTSSLAMYKHSILQNGNKNSNYKSSLPSSPTSRLQSDPFLATHKFVGTSNNFAAQKKSLGSMKLEAIQQKERTSVLGRHKNNYSQNSNYVTGVEVMKNKDLLN